ncbi:MAG: peptidoglycan-N-acetylglucosamine deacetylase [Solirubrobacteraceae bacterium]
MSASPEIEWPGGHQVCVALTFDFDADVGVGWRQLDRRLTSLSEARFGARRGIPRILDVLARRGLRATFYVPGEIAELHPDLVRAIRDGGHEIGHHGYVHLWTDKASPAEQRTEIERGIEALVDCVGAAPTGFRSPAWELTPETLQIVTELGFRWDSSCMGDDRPYFESHRGASILELPVHWSLDDWVYFAFARDAGGVMAAPDALHNAWLLEFESALAERRMVTYTMHPEAMGRGYRMLILERLLDAMQQRGDVWFATHREVADLVLQGRAAE